MFDDWLRATRRFSRCSASLAPSLAHADRAEVEGRIQAPAREQGWVALVDALPLCLMVQPLRRATFPGDGTTAVGRLARSQGSRYQRVMSEEIRAILNRLRAPPDNVVVRARRIVEAHVPEERRGPGWDRHWRELEAYLELPGRWLGVERPGE